MYSFVLLAGGSGTRMKNPMPKQYMLLAGKPVIMHTLERIDTIDEIGETIIVCAEEYIEKIKFMMEQYGIVKRVSFALSGKTRQESVYSGLEKATYDNVIIHEAARPFVKKEEFGELIACQEDNVIIGSPISFTVLKGAGKVEDILNRSELVNVQLPQKFNLELLKNAHYKAKVDGILFTEDASLVHYYYPDVEIKIIAGKDYNIKVTTPTDMIIGKMIYDEYFSRRSD